MKQGIDEFAKEFFQDVVSDADADGRLTPDSFFELFTQHLVDAGELETADRAFHLVKSTGVRVDGYGGDPLQAEGTLSLIISDFHQAPEVFGLNPSEMNDILARPTRFLRRAVDPKWRLALEESSPAFGLADLIAQRWAKISKVRILLITNRELSERISGREADEFDGKPVTYSVWDLRRLHRFATEGRGREDIVIDLVQEFGKPLPVLPAHLTNDTYEAYLAVMPASMLAAIYDRWGARLLEQNVRVFLQARGNVNRGIRGTIEQDPSMFFAYNNGITATAEKVEFGTASDREIRTIRNLQIVNGGQTTASIHAALRRKTDLSGVFVQMKLSIVDPQRATEVVPRISEYANSQNRVSAADFFSNHPFHVRMEDFSRRIHAPSPDGTFRETKWFYERARGQYADARSLLTPAERRKFGEENPRSQLFSKTDLAKFRNVWEGVPHKVSLGAQKNFAFFAHSIGRDWRKNESDYNEAYYRESIAKAIIFRSLEKLVSEQPWYEGGYRANIVAYAIAKLSHEIDHVEGEFDFAAVWKRQAVSDPTKAVLIDIAEQVTTVLTNPPVGIVNVTEWAKKEGCWERVKALPFELPEPFLAELGTVEDRASERRTARGDQRMTDGIFAQSRVVEAGGTVWKDILDWGIRRRLLSAADVGVLNVAASIPRKVPTEAQASRALAAFERLKSEGCPIDLQ